MPPEGSPVIELRIHGVGGSPGPRLLGLESDEDVLVVGEGIGARFLAPRHRPGHAQQEGYDWGGLTSDAATQPLWVFLLPFTLMNVAGWTYPDVGGPRARLVRGLVHVCGGLLSATWTCWLAIVTADLLGYQWAGAKLGASRAWAVAGLAVAGAVMFGIGAIAGRSIKAYEKTDVVLVDERPDWWKAEEKLTDPTFFAHSKSVTRLLIAHCVLVAATLVALALQMQMNWNGDRSLALGAIYRPLVTAQGMALLLLAVVGLSGYRPAARLTSPGRAWWHPWLAVLRPFAAASLAMALTTGVFSGLVLFTRDRLAGDGPMPAVVTGEELEMVDGSFLILLAWILLLAAYVLRYWVGPRADDVPDRRAPAGRPLDGAEPSLKRQVGRARRLARATHGMANVLTVLSVIGMAMSFGFVLYRFGIPTWVPLLGPTRGHPLDLQSLPARGAAWFFPLFTLFIVGLVQRAAFGSKTRRTVGILWDVLSFWPRRFHPFAIRPYAERAVPEFQARLLMHLGPEPTSKDPRPRDSKPVLISAHSQGSIIATAALAPLIQERAPDAEQAPPTGDDKPPPTGDDRISRVALLTYGCPLRTLYESAFSAYFSPQLFAALRDRVAKAPDGGPMWVNLWRLTDPIGGPVFTAAGATLPDLEVCDPAIGPAPDSSVWKEPDAEPLRAPWTDIAGHSHFHRELKYKAERQRLCAGLAPTPRAAHRRSRQTDDDEAGTEDWADYSDLADATDWEKLYKEKG